MKFTIYPNSHGSSSAVAMENAAGHAWAGIPNHLERPQNPTRPFVSLSWGLEGRVEALHFPRLFVVLFCHEKSTEKYQTRSIEVPPM